MFGVRDVHPMVGRLNKRSSRDVSGWVSRRPVTVGVSLFFVLWFALQAVVASAFGMETMRWWFYFEHYQQYPPPVQPGMLFAPLSHDLHDLTHLPTNVGMLLVVGGLAEPYIGGRRVLFFVIGMGYISTFLTNATAPFHLFWSIAGVSGGGLALLAYTALRLRYRKRRVSPGELHHPDSIEDALAMYLLLALPVLLLYEFLINWNIAHLFGLLLGCVGYGVDRYVFSPKGRNQADRS